VKKVILLFWALLLPFSGSPEARKITTAEEFYSLYRENLIPQTIYHETVEANILYLQWGIRAPFEHPSRGLIQVENRSQRERYKALLRMRMNFLLMRSYLDLGWQYDKSKLLYYNEEFNEEIIDSLFEAEECYWSAVHTFAETLKWAKKATSHSRPFRKLASFEEERNRLLTRHRSHDYARVIRARLKSVGKMLAFFKLKYFEAYTRVRNERPHRLVRALELDPREKVPLAPGEKVEPETLWGMKPDPDYVPQP